MDQNNNTPAHNLREITVSDYHTPEGSDPSNIAIKVDICISGPTGVQHRATAITTGSWADWDYADCAEDCFAAALQTIEVDLQDKTDAAFARLQKEGEA